VIYLDNAASSWPKPDGVATAMIEMLAIGGNPGRSGHRLSLEAGRGVYAVREAVAGLFSQPDPLRVVFTQNATESLNLALAGYLRPGDHVITSSMEHNSVMRPLRRLEELGVELTVLPCSATGELDPADLAPALRRNTVLIALNHASNIIGTVQPVAAVGRFAREHDLLLLVDAAQSAGVLPVDIQQDRIDLLAFTGHKGLLGPSGTGGLVIGERVDCERLQPLTRGGTGSWSERESQPDQLPDRYESGTRNAPGLAGLGAALDWLRGQGIAQLQQREADLVNRLQKGLREIPGVTAYGPARAEQRTCAVSFTIADQLPSTTGLRLEEEHGILCRVGLHCTPASHRTLGTFPAGTVRLSPGVFTTAGEIETTLAAVAEVAAAERND